MPSKHKLRKSSSANSTSSECSKELRELPEKDYRELLASVAGLPKKIHATEKGGLSPGSGADVVICGKEQAKLTPAAQACLEKLVGEIKSSNARADNSRDNCTSLDDWFMARRREAISAFTSAKKNPVRYEREEMKYIDEDKKFSDVELMDLSGTSSSKRTFTRGNREQTATEYVDDDVETGISRGIEGSRHGFFDEWNERSLLRNGRLLNRTQTILGPQSDGAFFPITGFINGTDVIPSLNPTYEMPPLSKPLLPTPPTGNDVTSSGQNNLPVYSVSPEMITLHSEADENGVSSNIEDVFKTPAVQDVAQNAKPEQPGKRKKGKKEKKQEIVTAEMLPGHMGQLSVEQLVNLIEGSNSSEQQRNIKKQGHKEKSSAVEIVAEEASQTKKERRRKSKELKENSATSASTTVTIGAQQTKNGGSTAASTVGVTASSPVEAAPAQSPKLEFTVASKRVTSPASDKKRGKGCAERGTRSQTDEGDEEFLSADEGIAPPPTIVKEKHSPRTNNATTLTTVATSTAKSSASEVILDGRNYRADDEDVTQIERQCADEQEFITVNTKKKKLLESNGKQQRTGSAGKDERHLRLAAERLEPTRRSSLGVAPEARSNSSLHSPLPLNSPQPNPRRPATTLLADFLDEKVVEGGRVQTRSLPVSNASKNAKKFHRIERSSQPDVEIALPDFPVEQPMSKPQSVTSDSPERAFSYADAAKKSSEPSRDNSPAFISVASPSSKSESPTSQTPTPALNATMDSNTADVVPCADVPAGVSGAADGLSFFYDETEATQSEENLEGENEANTNSAFVLNLGGKTVRFAKGMASPAVDAPPSNSHHMCMVEMLAQRWKMFQEGHVPKIYQPRIVSS